MDKMEINEQQLNRIKELMSFKPMNESTQKNFGSEIVEYQKMAGDNKTYAIVREGKKYFIKVSDKASNILKEDFDFIGGFCNKSRYEYSSFNKALRNLELKVRSINEGVDKKDAKFEIHDADRTINFLSEDKAQMSKEIKRQRQLMMHAIGMVNEGVEPKVNEDLGNFYDGMSPKDAIRKASVDHSFARRGGDVGRADKIVGNLKTHLEKQNYNWKTDPYALELLSDFIQTETITDMKVDEPKKGKTYKVTEEQLKQVKESYGQLDYDLMAGDDDDFGVKGWGKGVTEDAEENVEISTEDDNEPFIPQGSYTISNAGGYLVQIDDSGEMARVKESFGGEDGLVSDWLPIEFVEDEDGELDGDGYPDMIPVIDPNGYNIPLNQVMRINFNESVKESYGQLDYDLMAGDDDDFGVEGWGKGVTEDKEEEFEIEEDDLVEMITNILKKKL